MTTNLHWMDCLTWHVQRKDNSPTITDRLLTEVYKFLNNYSSVIINEVFYLKQKTYNLWNSHAFANYVSRNNYLLNFVDCRTDQLSEALLFDLKNSCLLELFKNGLKSWLYGECLCQVCFKFTNDYFSVIIDDVLHLRQNCYNLWNFQCSF